MKILLLVFAGIAVLVLAVVLIGLLLPKMHVASRSAAFRAAPEQLFALIAGPQSWRPDVLRCESVADANGRDLMRETTRNGETVGSYSPDVANPPHRYRKSSLRRILDLLTSTGKRRDDRPHHRTWRSL
jgi:hypothetical protein